MTDAKWLLIAIAVFIATGFMWEGLFIGLAIVAGLVGGGVCECKPWERWN